MAQHKRQHFVPQSYLKAWCDPSTPEGQEPYVWRLARDGSSCRRKGPENIFYEPDLYTIQLPGGGRDLTLEHGLHDLEDRFVTIRDTRLAALDSLDQVEHAFLCAFIAAAHARTPLQRDHQRQQWGNVLASADRMTEWARTATVEQKKRLAPGPPRREPSPGTTIGYDEIKAMAEKPLQNALIPSIQAEAALLSLLDLTVIYTSATESQGFITSDNPCLWFDPEAYKRPPFFQRPALMYPSIEITFPVSPRQMIWLNRRSIFGYLPASQQSLDELNRRTRLGCREYFINNSQVTRSAWFDPGIEPPDSWRKQHPEEASE